MLAYMTSLICMIWKSKNVPTYVKKNSEVTWQAQNIALIVTGQLSNVMMIDNVKTIQTNSFYGDGS